jgi:hypothetical protein
MTSPGYSPDLELCLRSPGASAPPDRQSPAPVRNERLVHRQSPVLCPNERLVHRQSPALCRKQRLARRARMASSAGRVRPEACEWRSRRPSAPQGQVMMHPGRHFPLHHHLRDPAPRGGEFHPAREILCPRARRRGDDDDGDTAGARAARRGAPPSAAAGVSRPPLIIIITSGRGAPPRNVRVRPRYATEAAAATTGGCRSVRSTSPRDGREGPSQSRSAPPPHSGAGVPRPGSRSLVPALNSGTSCRETASSREATVPRIWHHRLAMTDEERTSTEGEPDEDSEQRHGRRTRHCAPAARRLVGLATRQDREVLTKSTEVHL